MSKKMNDDAMITIPGYGKLSYGSLKKEVVARFKDCLKWSEKSEFKNVYWVLTQKDSVFQAQLKILADIEDGKFTVTTK